MIPDPPTIRRLCLTVDVEAYSARTTRQAQVDVQNRVLWAIAQACRTAKINPARCDRQDAGDGQLLILPAGVDEVVVVPGLALGLLSAVARINDPVGIGDRIRVRMALGQGGVQKSAMGYVGPAVVLISRLVDSDELRAALSSQRRGDLAFIVTTDLYDDVFSQGSGGLPASGFTSVHISKPAKSAFGADAWIQVPDRVTPLPSFPQYSEGEWLRRNQRPKRIGVALAGVSAASATAAAWAAFAGRRHEDEHALDLDLDLEMDSGLDSEDRFASDAADAADDGATDVLEDDDAAEEHAFDPGADDGDGEMLGGDHDFLDAASEGGYGGGDPDDADLDDADGLADYSAAGGY